MFKLKKKKQKEPEKISDEELKMIKEQEMARLLKLREDLKSKEVEDEEKYKEYINLYATDKDILCLSNKLCDALKNVIKKKINYLSSVISEGEELAPQFLYLIYTEEGIDCWYYDNGFFCETVLFEDVNITPVINPIKCKAVAGIVIYTICNYIESINNDPNIFVSYNFSQLRWDTKYIDDEYVPIKVLRVCLPNKLGDIKTGAYICMTQNKPVKMRTL